MHEKQKGAVMRERYVKVSAIMAAMVFTLAGCGAKIPDMTREEEQVVGEYAAMLLMKYDANSRSRLISREEVEAEKLKQAQLEEKKKMEETAKETPTQEEQKDHTPAVGTEQQPGADTVGRPEEFFGLPEGIVISYKEYEVCDSYPQDAETNTYLALDAAEGKRLVVLKFNMENQSQAEQHIDIWSQNAVIRITANGSYGRNVLTTMLMDDMSTYTGDIPAGETIELVLLAELDRDVADNIATLMLNLKNESKTCTIQLK